MVLNSNEDGVLLSNKMICFVSNEEFKDVNIQKNFQIKKMKLEYDRYDYVDIKSIGNKHIDMIYLYYSPIDDIGDLSLNIIKKKEAKHQLVACNIQDKNNNLCIEVFDDEFTDKNKNILVNLSDYYLGEFLENVKFLISSDIVKKIKLDKSVEFFEFVELYQRIMVDIIQIEGEIMTCIRYFRKNNELAKFLEETHLMLVLLFFELQILEILPGVVYGSLKYETSLYNNRISSPKSVIQDVIFNRIYKKNNMFLSKDRRDKLKELKSRFVINDDIDKKLNEICDVGKAVEGYFEKFRKISDRQNCERSQRYLKRRNKAFEPYYEEMCELKKKDCRIKIVRKYINAIIEYFKFKIEVEDIVLYNKIIHQKFYDSIDAFVYIEEIRMQNIDQSTFYKLIFRLESFFSDFPEVTLDELMNDEIIRYLTINDIVDDIGSIMGLFKDGDRKRIQELQEYWTKLSKEDGKDQMFINEVILIEGAKEFFYTFNDFPCKNEELEIEDGFFGNNRRFWVIAIISSVVISITVLIYLYIKEEFFHKNL